MDKKVEDPIEERINWNGFINHQQLSSLINETDKRCDLSRVIDRLVTENKVEASIYNEERIYKKC